ncbi:LysE family translocator [Aureivirga sp. CE67]|uniref:LysE family translocator n=1 Tax=Aureivirga sp. CE67 TaxID=1788983 RepID=UPI0018C937E4|nr:LysE family translocator [Aureivirga sp. CE67]
MFGVENFYVFVITALLFIMTPGIDSVFVLNKSVSQGKKAGIYSTLGINGGVIVHTLFAALGLSMLVAKSAMAFMVVKYLGAAYLIYLGISSIISKKQPDFNMEVKEQSNKKHFFSGLVTNTLNPKVALFFLSFFPQFIQKEQIENPVPFIVLGVTYALIGILWFSVMSFFAATFSEKVKGNEKFHNRLNKISGAIYILMGLKIALTKK